MMKLSVIIPTLNEAENIRELIPYLLKQGGGFISEVIVVDGGSNDETCRIAASLGAQVINSEIKSRAVQMNLGAAHAKGNTLFFLFMRIRDLFCHLQRIFKSPWSRDTKQDVFGTDLILKLFFIKVKFVVYSLQWAFFWRRGSDLVYNQ